ncbi:hypothetical protein Ndes2526B_g06585 [Nannochloris sp. 'desiccata']|nr:hypothetical protein KSW81_008317 [Chlorella desiccata (nom. nud.)]KAH7619606.1 putative Acyl carrier protein 2, mitochondrial [Chlorella desiccata (nom. nud.)]
MAFLQRTFAAVRQGVLNNVRLTPGIGMQSEAMAPVSLQFLRFFAADASYLDKKDVTDRVINVVKNFEKVDAGKKDLGLDSLDTVELVMAIEEEFAIEIPDSEADKILSCSDAISFVATNPMAR